MSFWTRPRQPTCRRCTRLRRLLCVGLLAALLPALPGTPGAQPAPPVATPAPALAASAASAAAVTSAASAASGADLIYNRLQLVQLQVDKAWKGMDLVRAGKLPFKLLFDPDKLPSGMAINDKGFLSGTPTVVDDYPFVLRLEDANRATEQRYLIRVRGPVVAKPQGPLVSMPPTSATLKPDLPPGVPRVWLLTEKDIAELSVWTEDEQKAADKAEQGGLPVRVPTEDQLKAILGPLQDREFPTEALLRHALQASVCDYFRFHVRAVAKLLDKSIDDTCPPRKSALEAAEGRQSIPALHPQASRRAVALLRDARALAEGKPATAPSTLPSMSSAPTAGAASGPAGKPAAAKGKHKDKPLAEFYDELLTADLAREVVQKAEKERPFYKATPLALAPPAPPARACLCRPDTTDEAMGLFAYWHGAKEAQQVNFSLFSRVTWLGAELDDNGSVRLAEPNGAAQPLAFVRAARQYGVKVDLGLHRRDWALLHGATDKRVDELAASAAAQAWKQLQTKLVDSTAWWQGFLIKGWRDPDWAFEGLTIFFEDTLESDKSGDRERYGRFLDSFARAVMQQMRRTGSAGGTPTPSGSKADVATAPRADRPYRLNIVVPDHLVQADGVFGLDRLWSLLEESERVLNKKQIEDLRLSLVQDRSGERPVHTDITVNFLVLLSDPTSDFKKLLRARLDDSRNIRGHDRVALLNSIVPVLMTRRDTTLPLGAGKDALNDDFAYARWNYGGVGLWPMPVEGVGQGSEVSKLMAETYGAAPRWSDPICQWGCPWRVPLRLSMQALVLGCALLASLYLWNCRVRELGRSVALVLLGGAFITSLVGAVLATCDPLLQQSDLTSMLLAGVILCALVFGLWRTLRQPE